MKRYTLLFACLLIAAATVASTPDTVVTVTGKLISSEDNTPVQGTIEYKKLPYGSEVGRISSNANGEYTIYVHGSSNYSVKVSADGHFDLTDQVTISSAAMTKDFRLSGGGAGTVFTLENLIFEMGDDEITSASFTELDDLASRLQANPAMIIQLEGHTDTRGDAQQNMNLSQRRVDAVKAYLVGKGTNPSQVQTKAFGGTKPLSTEDTEEAHASNRRVEVRVIKVE